MAVKAVYVELLEEQMCPCQKRKLEQALDNANAEIATLNTQIAALNTTVAEKDNRITELENQVANPAQPSGDNNAPDTGNSSDANSGTGSNEADTTGNEPEPEFDLTVSVVGQFPPELRVGRSFNKYITLIGSNGVEGAYYPFELYLPNEGSARYTLEVTSGNVRNVTFENGVLKGEVSQGTSQFTITGTFIEAGFARELYPANAWNYFSYHQTQAGKRYSDHNVEITDTYDIQPETGDLGERHPVEIVDND